MLDPAPLLENDVEEVCDVAGREDSRLARFQMLVDQDAVPKLDAAVVQKPNIWRYANRNDHQVARKDITGAGRYRLYAAAALKTTAATSRAVRFLVPRRSG